MSPRRGGGRAGARGTACCRVRLRKGGGGGGRYSVSPSSTTPTRRRSFGRTDKKKTAPRHGAEDPVLQVGVLEEGQALPLRMRQRRVARPLALDRLVRSIGWLRAIVQSTGHGDTTHALVGGGRHFHPYTLA